MSLLEAAIGILAPPECIICQQEGAVLCTSCANSTITAFGERCWQCNALSPRCRTCENCRRDGAPKHVWVTTNYEAAARELIWSYKFHHQRIAAESLTRLMAKTFLDYNSASELSRINYLLMPIPTATKRIRQRSFDHILLLTRHLSRRLELERASVLGRIGQISQVGAPRTVRLAQAESQYFVRDSCKVARRNILLIDDVLTTGATLRAVTKALRAAGASQVDALVFAKRL